MKNVLLITGCISPSNNAIFLKINNSKTRLKQYINTIDWALNESNFDVIIFCDNSNYDYDFNYLNRSNKVFEYLTFNGDFAKSNEYGKGYGEGEIIKFAFENSKYLKKTINFYKLTGRLIVENIKKILGSSKDKNYFLNFLFSKNAIDTRFYKINTKSYIKYFLEVYENVRDKEGYALEHVFYSTMRKNNIKYFCFRNYPIISGISGSTGIEYHTTMIKLFIYNCLCKMNLYNKRIVSNMVLKIIKK